MNVTRIYVLFCRRKRLIITNYYGYLCVDVNEFYSDFTCLPRQMLGGYGEFLYQTGMIDEFQKQYVDKQTDLGVKLIQQEMWVEAFQVTLGISKHRFASFIIRYVVLLMHRW